MNSRLKSVKRSNIDQCSEGLGLYGSQRATNILSTEAPTEFGGNLRRYPAEKPHKNRKLGWLFFDLRAAGHGLLDL
jgi:hypothetical protein